MNVSYSAIGPFRGVPETSRALAAARADASAKAAVSAAIREAREIGDAAYEHQAFFPAPSVLGRLDGEVYPDTVSSLRSARIDMAVGLAFLVCVVFISVFLAIRGSMNGYSAAASVAWGGTVLVPMSVFVWFTILSSAVRARRELLSQGYLGDELPSTAARIAGNCWVPTDKALYVVQNGFEGKPVVRTVFYDAIGRASLHVEDGREYTRITARDGSPIASLESPKGGQVVGAHALADLIFAKAARTRPE